MSKRRKKSQELTAFMLSSVILAGITPTAVGVTATMSGNHQTGMEFDSPSGGDYSVNENNFTVSLSETTDGGMTISSSFMLMDESTPSNVEDAGFTLTFTDGSKLDIINAGNAAGSHDVSIPDHYGSGNTSKSLEDNPGISSTQTLEYEDPAAFGVEYHTASDFLADGLKMSHTTSHDYRSDSYNTDTHYAIGATYVTSPGDTAVTIGTAHHHDSSAADVGGHHHVGLSAVTGDLTVAVGFADGDADGHELSDSDVVEAGVKYVTGDLTFNVGEPSDSDTTYATGAQSKEMTSDSVSYTVPSGNTAVLGYTTVDDSDDDLTDGSAWYIGANMGF